MNFKTLKSMQSKNKNMQSAILQYAADANDPTAQFQLGLRYAHGEGVPQNDRYAVKWFRKAAENYAPAQCYLGECYEFGDGVREDINKAFKWYTKAALPRKVVSPQVFPHEVTQEEDKGYADAQCALGHCYALGKGVAKDEKKAVELYINAAEQGHLALDNYI